ncbi:hypothetical protein CD58_23205 [Pseudomonas brassicacearum]|nr:hypothetical protein CD58_23205 [Pseudomonas brassicacearum]
MAKLWLFYRQIIQLLFMKGMTFISLRRGAQPDKIALSEGEQVVKEEWSVPVKKFMAHYFPGNL